MLIFFIIIFIFICYLNDFGKYIIAQTLQTIDLFDLQNEI